MTGTGRSLIAASALAAAVLAAGGAAALPAATPPTRAAVRAEPAQFYGYRGPYWRYGLRRPFPGYRRFGLRPYGVRPYGFGYGGALRPYGFRGPYGYGFRRF